mmetsp:Transcript_30258/g.100268  ORF Transcript_30258/g.100268 Transcript_30258/m.100268 type:complete len:394 (-) Transcript_30258:151-1332(-)
MLSNHALHVAIERERARRLVDRFGRDASEGGELARERRAHEVSAVLRSSEIALGDAGRRIEGVRRLEEKLDHERRSQLQGLLRVNGHSTTSATAPPAVAAAPAPAPANAGVPFARPPQGFGAFAPSGVSPHPSVVAAGMYDIQSTTAGHGPAAPGPTPGAVVAVTATSAFDAPLPQKPPPQRMPSLGGLSAPPATAGGRAEAFEALKSTLDEISVKSVLDFRSAGAGVLAAEAVATAAACAIANIDETVQLCIDDIDPEAPWVDALKILGKPGHFINSLRRFPWATDAGRVPEDNIMAAKHFLAMAEMEDDFGHPAVFGLSRWVECAIIYWEEHCLGSAESELNDSGISADAARSVPSPPRPAQPAAPSAAVAAPLGQVAPHQRVAAPPGSTI